MGFVFVHATGYQQCFREPWSSMRGQQYAVLDISGASRHRTALAEKTALVETSILFLLITNEVSYTGFITFKNHHASLNNAPN